MNRGMPTRAHGPALAAVLGMCLLGYGFLLAPGRAPYSPCSDFVALGLGAKTVLYQSLQAGRGLPFWRDDEFSGNAALTDPQNGYTSILNAPFWVWPPLKAAGPALWLFFLAAGLSGYAGGCALGLGLWASLLTAAASMFHFKLIIAGYAGWLPSFTGAALCPLLLAAAWRALDRPSIGAALGLGAAGGLCIHAGHLQLLYYSSLFLAASAILKTGAARLPEEKRGAWRGVAALTAGAALAAGLSACVLLPLAADAPLLSRGLPSYALFLSGHSLAPRHLLTFLAPEILGTPLDGSYPAVELWEDVAYFGLVPLVLAVAGAVLARRRPAARFLAGAFLVAVVLSLQSPLQRLLFEALPGFQLFRVPGRFLFFAGWFGIALAGFGLDEILHRMRERASKAALAAGAACPRPALLARACRLRGTWLAACLIAGIALEGSWHARRYLTMVPQEQLIPEAGYRSFFAARKGLYRIVPLERSAVNYGWAAPMGLQLATGYGSFNYSHYQTYCDLLRWGKTRPEGARVWTDISEISRPDMLDALNVRYLVSKRALDFPPGRFSLAARLPDEPVFELYKGFSRSDLFIYENRNALPRAFFVDRTVSARSPQEAVSLMQGAGSLRGMAVVEDGRAQAGSGAGPADLVEAAQAHPGKLEVRLRSRDLRYLVISEVWNPGWRARLDGAELALHKTDVALMGAWIPPGEHQLVLSFEPSGWRWGLAITALSVFFFLLPAWRLRR
ncbi:MAG: YfhO family protein [Elusimicrobia bacterium]|nr:YfhO family protein [Elusimicrobiota bacterium]